MKFAVFCVFQKSMRPNVYIKRPRLLFYKRGVCRLFSGGAKTPRAACGPGLGKRSAQQLFQLVDQAAKLCQRGVHRLGAGHIHARALEQMGLLEQPPFKKPR